MGTFDFAEFALELSSADGTRGALRTALETIREVVEAERGGAMLVVKRHVEAAEADDELASQADRLQLDLESGPCLEAIGDEAVYLIVDTLTDPRWEPWCRGLAQLGIRSVLSLRLATLNGTLGALNLYHSVPGAFGESHGVVGARLASQASVAIAATKTEEGLREAMAGRHVIGLAQGILMERFGLDEEAAFSVLRRYSQDLNLKLRVVAQELVKSRALPSLDAQGRHRPTEGGRA
ncbi:GAF and ANTAR domain-containing protein [Dermatophilus congolensis]|uniref:ANTAR domain n=1 Tax=Dermatophilus congolensis TaxID=1863 RepID=A0A239VAJ5_9MICO|nr:GAF and ANTAR domain-containing protein [Dermatophilus congolensis]MBO3130658.1 GAF and ANTAR domain-containing protein [Dermatophilus congolensis]MBO3130712.1 GAF and ANTAR domain-containing protein [Dermatophilus congolensis]MBO3135131.1 GAF and ANTAR domain-containing protein [Dermatophilus congolensis]MBO3137370.1 GAF and ANTAR domain-containing protein [Dermatophilus congolensis]MBO3139611.1 GAF and ANTAR domain-containing protein [Dermatophilus congolensis]